MAEREYIIFLDESEKKGAFFSNFYGGVIVAGSRYEYLTSLLNEKKRELCFFGEVKWSKVSESYLAKYIALIQVFFNALSAGDIRVRLMFRQNAHQPQRLSREQVESEYFRLYYQFVKHGFGLMSLPRHDHPVNLRLYFDDLPDTEEKRQQFKGYVLGLGANPIIAAQGIRLLVENITEVRSHDHVLLQCLDIVLGAMAFRLNNKHRQKIPGQLHRGKKTVAKELLYKAIYSEIQRIRPGLNIGISTGLRGLEHGRWSEPYLHWKFIPKDSVWDPSRTKP